AVRACGSEHCVAHRATQCSAASDNEERAAPKQGGPLIDRRRKKVQQPVGLRRAWFQAFLAPCLAGAALAGAVWSASRHFASLIAALRLRMACALGSCGMGLLIGPRI